MMVGILISDLRGTAFNISPLGVMFALQGFVDTFQKRNKLILTSWITVIFKLWINIIFNISNIICINIVLLNINFIKIFLYLLRWSHEYYLYSVNMMNMMIILVDFQMNFLFLNYIQLDWDILIFVKVQVDESHSEKIGLRTGEERALRLAVFNGRRGFPPKPNQEAA